MATEVENTVPVAATEPPTKGGDETATTPTADAKAEEAAKEAGAGSDQATKEPAPPKIVVHKANFEKDVVYLYQFSRTPVLPSMSPYCLKVETFLRLANIKYENVDHKMKYRSKKGLLPFIEINGEEVADSSIIIKELSQKFDINLDGSLTDAERDKSHLIVSMVENSMAWVVMWWRSKHPDETIKGYKVNLQHALGSKIPNAILNMCFKFTFTRKGMKKVKAQGIGCHSCEEIIAIGKRDLEVLSNELGDKPFYFGDDPTILDIVAFAHVAQIYFIDKEVTYVFRDYINESCSNLVGHVNRMKERCFPDWDDICTTLDLNSHIPKPPPEEGKDKEGEKNEKEGDKEKEADDKDIEKEKADEKEKDKKEKATEDNKEKDTK